MVPLDGFPYSQANSICCSLPISAFWRISRSRWEQRRRGVHNQDTVIHALQLIRNLGSFLLFVFQLASPSTSFLSIALGVPGSSSWNFKWLGIRQESENLSSKLDITTAWMTVMAMCSLCGSERHKHHHSTLSFTTEAQLPYTQGNHCATLLVPYRTWIGMNSFQVCPSHSLTSEYDPWKMAFSTIDLPCNQTPLRSNRFRNTNSSQDDPSYFPFSNRDDL